MSSQVESAKIKAELKRLESAVENLTDSRIREIILPESGHVERGYTGFRALCEGLRNQKSPLALKACPSRSR
jgi:hypothetical protein